MLPLARDFDSMDSGVNRRVREISTPFVVACPAAVRVAGAITRASENHRDLAERNLKGEAASLRARIRKIEMRLGAPAGGRRGRIAGYAASLERHSKLQRLQVLRARLVSRPGNSGTG
jgi:hypothetical protein